MIMEVADQKPIFLARDEVVGINKQPAPELVGIGRGR